MTEHEHSFDDLLWAVENEHGSRDELHHCRCGAVRHVYTWRAGKPEGVRHEWIKLPTAATFATCGGPGPLHYLKPGRTCLACGTNCDDCGGSYG